MFRSKPRYENFLITMDFTTFMHGFAASVRSSFPWGAGANIPKRNE